MPDMRDGGRFWLVLGVLAAAAVGGFFWLRGASEPAQQVAPAPPPPPPPPEPDAAPAPPDIAHPLPAAEGAQRGLPGTLEEADAYAEDALKRLLGRKTVRDLLNLTGVARGVVATVDNLATPVAAPHLWPVKTMAGRFLVEGEAATGPISAANAERYDDVVRMLTKVDTRKAVGLYRRLYPLLQQAYEDMGYPGKYFNDRVVEVIDHLLATPTPPGPLAVRQPHSDEAHVRSNLYLFDDPELEALTSGQKILLRVGPEHAARLKDKLRDIRGQIARKPPSE